MSKCGHKHESADLLTHAGIVPSRCNFPSQHHCSSKMPTAAKMAAQADKAESAAYMKTYSHTAVQWSPDLNGNATLSKG